MQCYKCDFYISGQTSNKCMLTCSENFRTVLEDKQCNCIDDNYIFTEDCDPMGFVKGRDARKFIEGYFNFDKRLNKTAISIGE